MSELSIDPELNAIQTIIASLEPLDTEARQRVVSYVFQRLRLSLDSQPPQASNPILPSVADISQPIITAQIIHNIRSLKEQKAPRSASEMCAIVAYYLAELAPVEERKDSIDRDDAVKYFKQANFPLPKSLKQIMPNAAKAGYFDALGDGKYRLNPVGYNLVVHGLQAKQK
jgi:hypothetical protein